MEKDFDLGVFILEAYNLYKSKNYNAAINFIETLINKYKRIDDSYLQYILILSYLHTGNFYKVDQLIKIQKRYHKESKIIDEIEAYISLKGAPAIDQPLIKYIELTDKYSEDKKIRSVLNLLRACKNFEILQKSILLEQCISLEKPVYKRHIFNRKKSIKINFKYYLYKITVIVLSSFILFVIVFFIVNYIVKNSKIQYNTSPEKTALNKIIELDDERYSIVDENLESNFINKYGTDDELKNDFIKSQLLLKENKANESLIILNNILNSNANYSVKEKVQFLIEFINNIDLYERDYIEIDLQNLIDKPEIYRGIVFKSTGTANDIKIKGNKTIFSIEVMQKNKIYSMDVFFNNKVNIKNNEKIVLKAKFLNRINAEKLYVEGIEIKNY